jgi:hypothetical protein
LSDLRGKAQMASVAARDDRWMDRSGGLGGFGGRGPSEVAVFEAVAVALAGEDLGVVNEAVDHRGGG